MSDSYGIGNEAHEHIIRLFHAILYCTEELDQPSSNAARNAMPGYVRADPRIVLNKSFSTQCPLDLLQHIPQSQ